MKKFSKKQRIIINIIDKQFEIAGLKLRYKDVADSKIENWFQKYSYSAEQNLIWISYVIDILRKELKFSKKQAKSESEMLDLMFGLTIK